MYIYMPIHLSIYICAHLFINLRVATRAEELNIVALRCMCFILDASKICHKTVYRPAYLRCI